MDPYGTQSWRMRRVEHPTPHTLSSRRVLSGLTDHECLQQICKIGETKPRIQRWMELLSVYIFGFSYRRGRGNANADSLSRLPSLLLKVIPGSCALSNPDDPWGLINPRTCGFTPPLLPCLSPRAMWLWWASLFAPHCSKRWRG